MDDRTRTLVAAIVDLVLVAVFVLIGRASHREAGDGFGVTYWPFAVGLAAGWAAGRVWRAPFAIVRGGVPAWLGTVVVGMVLRTVAGQGVQVAFVVVATIVVGLLLLGWRTLLEAVDRASTRNGEAPGPIEFFLRRKPRR